MSSIEKQNPIKKITDISHTEENIAGELSDISTGFTNYQVIPHEQWLKDSLNKVIATYGGDPEEQLKNSHIVYSKIQIGGENVLKESHFTLKIHQKMASHDQFIITCPADAFDKKDDYPLTQARKLLGKRCTIQLVQFGQTTYIFTGIITNIAGKNTEGTPMLLITGKSPTILLENGKDSKSFQDNTLDEVIQKTSHRYPADLVQWNLQPHLNEKISYTVQYRESDYQFIKRLATKYGEWFYYNGQQIVFGGYGGKTVELLENRDVFDYELKMQLVPQKFTYLSHDIRQGMNHTVDSDDVPLTHRLVNPFQQHVIKTSEEVFPQKPSSLYNHSLLERGEWELKEAVKRQKLTRQNVFFLEARTNNPNLRLGDTIKLKAWMPGHAIFKNGETPLESYKIIEITHEQDLTEGYYNLITGVPVDNMVPPYMDEDAIPVCEEQTARVVDNKDPMKMGRIKAQFPWQTPFNGTTPWIRLIQPHAGAGKGIYFIPEIGEEIMTGFENGNAEKPYVLGTHYNGKELSGYYTDGNDNKVIHSRSGTRIVMNDAEGSIFIEDPSGNKMFMDGQGNISVNAPKNISVNAGEDIVLSAGRNMITSVGADQTTSVGVNSNTTVGRQYTLFATDIFETATNEKVSQADVIQETGGTVEKLATEGNVNAHGSKQVITNSGEKSNLF